MADYPWKPAAYLITSTIAVPDSVNDSDDEPAPKVKATAKAKPADDSADDGLDVEPAPKPEAEAAAKQQLTLLMILAMKPAPEPRTSEDFLAQAPSHGQQAHHHGSHESHRKQLKRQGESHVDKHLAVGLTQTTSAPPQLRSYMHGTRSSLVPLRT